MANGKTHDQAIFIATPVWGLLAFHTFGPLPAVTITAAHYLGGMYLSPDLDIKSAPYQRWGFLKLLWKPYQDLIPHRHWISHFPVVGTLLRLAYLGIVLSPVLLIIPPSLITYISWEYCLSVFIGLELAALNHLFLDGFPMPKFKKAKRASRKKRRTKTA